MVTMDTSEKARAAAGGLTEQPANGYPVHVVKQSQNPAELTEYIQSLSLKQREIPAVYCIGETAVYGIGNTKHDAEAVLRRFLSEEEISVPDKSPVNGRIHNCIAVVTGSAQGFGKGIAFELAREGASIVVADLNEKLGNACCDELNAAFGSGTALFRHCNVTESESIESVVLETIRAFGGVDLFVSNAGILKAGSLQEMDKKTFELVTGVNYTAFFLCTKAVSAVMKLQHSFFPDYYTDIIQINSKSGLQGSNKNFAYAASKFDGVGLTQSFALELVEYNIKVNAICPGNYYEGPLWADPENGLFVQYLRAGKVPGAKSIDDVKQFYLNKVPMKKGCSPYDVTRAILYAREQINETGQTIPVTGGQVMLH